MKLENRSTTSKPEKVQIGAGQNVPKPSNLVVKPKPPNPKKGDKKNDK